jgi:hypothetical protein
MKRFYTESGIMICEWESFERSIIFGSHGFKMTPEQWKNRRIGRTKLKDEERIAMIQVLTQLRKEQKRKKS